MFIAGLESNLSQLRKYLKPAFFVAAAGALIPVLVMAPASYFFGFTKTESVFIGVIFAATSVSISVAVLREFNQLSSQEGATILGAAVADDIIGVMMLSVMISVINGEGGNAHSSLPLWLALCLQVLFFGGTYLLVRWLAPYLMRISEHMRPRPSWR